MKSVAGGSTAFGAFNWPVHKKAGLMQTEWVPLV